MAKLTRLPAQSIIDGFKGNIDFYLWKGIPVARSWPRSPGSHRAPDVEAQWPAFTYATQNWQSLTPYVQTAYRRTAMGTHMTGRDVFVKSYLKDIFRENQWSGDDDPLDKQSHFTVLSVDQYLTPLGYNFKVVTDTNCHLYMYWTRYPPQRHNRYSDIRGLRHLDRVQYCFVSYHKNDELQAGDHQVHYFTKAPWEVCETRWFTFRATIGGFWSNSSTAIFEKHRTAIGSYHSVDSWPPNDVYYTNFQPWYVAQPFTASDTYYLRRLFLYASTHYGTVGVSVRHAYPGGGQPYGTDLVYKDISLPFGARNNIIDYDYQSALIEKGQEYCVVVKCSSYFAWRWSVGNNYNTWTSPDGWVNWYLVTGAPYAANLTTFWYG